MRGSFLSRKLCLAILAVAVAACGCARQPALSAISKGPFLQNPSSDAMTVRWEAGPEARLGVVHYGENKLDKTMEVAVAAVVQMPRSEADPVQVTSHWFEARLTGLKPSTTYQYTVELYGMRAPATQPAASPKPATMPATMASLPVPQPVPREQLAKLGETPVTQFTTSPESLAGQRQDNFAGGPVTFIAYGDSRARPAVHSRVAGQFRAHRPDFVLHSGDFVTRGPFWQEWKQMYFEPAGPAMARVPFWTVRGNHEGRGLQYASQFSAPISRHYYSFDYGPVHVVGLDCYDNPEMLRWCAEDLAATRQPWKIVFFHTPIYNFNDHASVVWRETYLPLFRKHGVDLVVSGHSHIYERFYPLRPADEPSAKPLTHVVSGGGGATFDHEDMLDSPFLAAKSRTPHFILVHIDGRKLSARVIDLDGKEIDRFEFSQIDTRRAGGAVAGGRTYDPGYMATVKDESQLQIDTLQFTMRAKGIPKQGEPYPFTLRITPPGLSKPLGVTCRVAPRSAGVYRLEPATIEAVVKPGEPFAVPVTLVASATPTADAGWLVPELYLEVTCDYGGVKTTFTKKVAYWW